VSDPLYGQALVEVRRLGPEANVVAIVSALEKSGDLGADGRTRILGLAVEALPIGLAEADAQKLVEARKPAQVAATWREAADQIEALPKHASEIASVASETVAGLLAEVANRCRYTPAPIGTLTRPPAGTDPNELLRHRFLCRGGGLLLAAPTGVGKSSLSVQFALCWALGRETLGLEPARPLRSLYIQAENDSADMAELRDGIAAGLGLSEADRARAFEAVTFATVDDVCGPDFISRAFAPLVDRVRPDVVFVDPLLSYLGGDASKQEVVSPFLRNGINPVLHRTCVGLVLVHHVNKPASGEQKAEWRAGDFAYIGSGSADLANWARAVLAIRSLGDHAVYELRAGKRGRRLGWTEADGTPSYARMIAHGMDGIYWRDAKPEEGPAPAGRKATATVEQLAGLLDGKEVGIADWRSLAADELGLSRSAFYRLKSEAESKRLVARSKVSDRWIKA
jgi:hypothetical protein